MENRYTLEFVVGKEEEGLLREFLLVHKGLSRKSLTKIKKKGRLLVNGLDVTVRAMLHEGDRVTVIFPEEQASCYLKPEPIPLDIIYEDEEVLIINKPAHICVHPTSSHREGTLANGVLHYWQEKGWTRTFHAVSRLDMNTSGLILIAQNRFSHHQLAKQQRARLIERRYYALVEGVVKEDQGVIEAPIGRKAGSIIEREVRADGQYAKTLFWVRQRYPDYTWLDIKLVTGRTHQIRVHLKHIGHPLLGDELYGGSLRLISRQALHAYYLGFQHPKTARPLSFQAPLPEDMSKLL